MWVMTGKLSWIIQEDAIRGDNAVGVEDRLLFPSTSSSSSRSTRFPVDPALCWRFGSNGSTTIDSVPLISARQNGQPTPSDSCKCMNHLIHLYFQRFNTLVLYIFNGTRIEVNTSIKFFHNADKRESIRKIFTCQAFRQGVQSRCPQGSMRMSLSFSAHILHN